MILRALIGPERPSYLKSARRPSAQPLLPSLANAVPHRGRKGLVVQVLAVVFGLYWLVQLGGWAARKEGAKPAVLALKSSSCEASGLATPLANIDDEKHRAVIRLRPAPADGAARARLPENTISHLPLHPALSSSLSSLFDGSALLSDTPANTKCIIPQTHFLPVHPRLEPSVNDPSLFFSVSTTPSRAQKSAPVWKHFMSPSPSSDTLDPADGSRPPYCLVTDAQGQNDKKGAALANAAFADAGVGCVFKDSMKAGDRYEMRVLSLVRDAWLESERRRWQDGAPLVEWFIFQDDDTWWSDPQMLRDMLFRLDWHEDHMLGGHSETVGNFQIFGKIAYGGAGIVMSRSLVQKMQGTLDKCAERFAHVFGGDGLLSECAAWTRGIPLDEVVEEVPAMRQMDIKGDATGYLTAGTAPFLTLHHWAGWLSIFPGVDGTSAIQLLAQAASVVGGPNFLRRWIFDDGAVTLTLGYAITVHRKKLDPEAVRAIEWTWEAHEPRRTSRPKLKEAEEKLTYYLTSVERLSPDVALLKHVCTSPIVQSSLREIEILWDVRAEQPSWSEQLFGKWGSASPSMKAAQARQEEDEQEQREREGGAFREKAKVKREVKFSG
ncbi:hypothetical protein JCM8547_000183 [Rhodosporidiobolus lusitaniae]